MAQFIVFLFSLFICGSVLAAPPVRQNVYVSGEAILASSVAANEDAIFNYLQGGVDTIADGTIVNADINASANIQSTKINLTSVAQNINNTGTLANTGAVTITGDTSITGDLTVSSDIYLGTSIVAPVPVGGIIIWSGSVASIGSISPGVWKLCDGNNGTPNLTDRFVMAAGNSYAVGATGDGSIPAHTHEQRAELNTNLTGGTAPITSNLNTGIANTGVQTGSYGSGTKVIATYYALAYIMRIQ